MQTTIYDTDGDEADRIDLPEVFETAYRPDLIEKAVRAARSQRTQPHGADGYAGKRTSAESPGAGTGRAMVPRANNRARRVPQAVGGRRAHPPKAEADPGKAINDQERQLATRSAIAATADPERVAERGHAFADDLTFPVVLTEAFGEIVKTQAVVDVLETLGIAADITRAEEGRSIRAGGGKRRGRKYRTPRSILFVTGEEQGPSRGARNLAGADVSTAAEVNVEDLAPGGDPGRLTVWTAPAVQEVADR